MVKAHASPARKPGKSKSNVKAKSGASNARKGAPRLQSALKADRARPGRSKVDGGGAGDWRQATLALMRALILKADPEMIEERKWRKPSNGMVGVPVWSHDGIVCTGEMYAKAVKLTFAQGASLPDPKRLFNSSLEGNMRRAIDIHEGEKVDEGAFQALVRAAVVENGKRSKKR